MKNKFLLYLLLAFALLLQVQAGFAQKKTILVTPGGKPLGGPGAAFMLAGPEIVETPVAGNVTVTGTAQEGQQLTVTYNYSDAQSDPEGATTFQWYRASDASGTGKAAISGATASTYTLDAADMGKYITAGVTPVANSGASPGAEVLADYAGPVTTSVLSCGTITVNHSPSDGVSPVTASITYGTVQITQAGVTKCWTAQNLGAAQQASSATDATAANAGWYWQFNRKQGYYFDGSTAVPFAGWQDPVNDNSDWQLTNDPCRIFLGSNWQLPSRNDWDGLVLNSGWGNLTDAYNSDIKLHAAGLLYDPSYAPDKVGMWGYYWSSTQNTTFNDSARGLYLTGSSAQTSSLGKVTAYPVRCVRYM